MNTSQSSYVRFCCAAGMRDKRSRSSTSEAPEMMGIMTTPLFSASALRSLLPSSLMFSCGGEDDPSGHNTSSHSVAFSEPETCNTCGTGCEYNLVMKYTLDALIRKRMYFSLLSTYRGLRNGVPCVCRSIASRVRIACPDNAY